MKTRKIISTLLTLAMILAIIPMNVVFAEGNELTLSITSPHDLDETITIDDTKTVEDLKNAVAEKCKVTFGGESKYRLYNGALSYPHSKLADDTKLLKDIGFVSGQTVHLEKSTYWEASEEQPIKIFGMTIIGGKGSQEPYGDYTNVDFYWNYSYKTIKIQTATPITISGTAENGAKIIINTGSSEWANLTIEDVTMTVEKSACITLNTQAQLNLTLVGTNKLTSKPGVEYGNSKNAPAIELCQSNSYLKINGSGNLTAESTCDGYPGIGSKDDGQNVKGVEINGGTIISTGGTGGAGILAKRIWIYGGNVTANGGLSAKSAFKIENAVVTANSDTKVFSGTLKPSLNGHYNAVASVNKDGTETETYDATKGNTYKYFKVIPKTDVSLIVDETQEYTYDGTAKTFTIPNDALDGFNVAYKQGESNIPDPTNVGSYDVVITRAEDDTYKSYSKTIENGLVIKQKEITNDNATIALGDSLTYNGTEQTQTISKVEVGDLTLTEDTDYMISNNKGMEVKNDYVLTITGKGNFTGTATKQFSIAKATPTENLDKKTTARVKRGKTLAEATVTEGEMLGLNDTVLEGTFAWVDDTRETINADCTKQMTFTPTDTNYAPITIDVAVSTYSSSGGGGTTRYTVKFNTNGGNTVTSQTVKKNSKATEPTEPTKDGYVFDGWYTDSEFANEYDFDTNVTKSITLYAKWTEKKIDDKDDNNNNPTPSEWKNPFTDITSADWFFDNVRYANENGLMSGTTDTTFAPNDNLTRGMLVTVLYRAEGEPAVNKSIPFADVNASQYYANAVIWAEQNGIVNGVSETEFAPDENITREQIATIIYRYAEYKGIAPTGAWAIKLDYADVADISDYAVEGVMYCTMKNIMQGKDNNMFAPKDNATRAEIAAILNRFIEGNK